MNVLALFDGMSCGQLALQRAGYKVDKYYASEIDKHAIDVTQHNFPETIQLGTVTQWQLWDIENDIDWASIDLILAGSPCQGFSCMGKGLAFDDPRSKLFFTFIDILEHARKFNPNVKFLLENVKMKKQFQDVITSFVGVGPVKICSSLLSAQTRGRLYWADWWFPVPKDRGLYIRDILDHPDEHAAHTITNRYYAKTPGTLSHKKSRQALRAPNEKMRCLATDGQHIKNNGATNIQIGDEIKKPSVSECERAQTVPVGYTAPAGSNTQRYKMLGNGWTVDVIAHILETMNYF